MGIVAKARRVWAQPFWRFIVFTAILCLLALVATRLLLSEFYQFDTRSSEVEFWDDGTRNYRIVLSTHLRKDPRNNSSTGNLEGDLITDSGKLVILEIQSPSLRYDVVDGTGRILMRLSRGPLDDAAVLKWMAFAELDPSDTKIRKIAGSVYLSICNELNVAPAQLPALQANSMNRGSTISASGSQRAPAALMPISIISWSIAWLLGTWTILRTQKPKSVRPSVRDEVAA